MSDADTMRTSVLTKAQTIVLEERSVPSAGPGEVLVRVAAVGICGSDVHYFEHGRSGDFVVESPLVLGHEASGVVVSVGPGVTLVTTGDRVSIEPGRPCRVCRYCVEGAYNLCVSMRFHATPPIDGSFAEYVVIHETCAHPVPDSVSDVEAAMLEPLSVGIWASRKARVSAGDRVLVNGSGPIGIIAMQVARAFGAAHVTVVDVNEFRLGVATDLGADRVVVAGSAEAADLVDDFDVMLECSGNGAATLWAIRQVAKLGRVVLIGSGPSELLVPLGAIQTRELEVHGVFRYANTWPLAIDLVASGRVRLEPLMSAQFGIDEVEAALRDPRDNPHSMKPVVFPARRGTAAERL